MTKLMEPAEQEPFVILGVLAGLGLYLRGPRLRPLVPWRRH